MRPLQLIRTMTIAIVSFVFMASSAWGQTYTLEWFDSNHTFVPNNSTINVTAGTPLTMNLYIHETNGTTLQSDLLGTFGMRTTYGTIGVLNVASTSSPNMVNNPLFDLRTSANTNASFAELAAAANITFPGNPSDANGRIWLGSFQYQTALGSTTLTASDIPVLNQQDWNLGNGINFDPLIVNSQINVNVNPVPEPSTVLLIGAGCLGLCRVIVRRRKAVAAPVLAA